MIRILTVIFSLATASNASPIRQADLPATIGFLHVDQVEKPGQMPSVASSHFEEIRVSTSDAQHRAWLNACIASRQASATGDLFFFEPDYSAVSDESGRNLLTIWTDCGFETIRQAIVVWKKKGDQLSDETVLDHALLAGIGRDSIKEIHDIGKGRHLLIGRSQGGDGGETWGAVWAGIWSEPRHFEITYSVDYRGNEESGAKIDFHYDSKHMRLNFKQMSGPTSNASQWKVDKTWSVDLKERLRQE